MINARAETVAERPAFREALRRRRCLVPANGFYEWQRAAHRRRPVRVTLRTGEPFAFAGLWEMGRGPAGEPIASCAIVTTAANGIVAPTHDRMPVILPRRAETAWIDPAIHDGALPSAMPAPHPAEAAALDPLALQSGFVAVGPGRPWGEASR